MVRCSHNLYNASSPGFGPGLKGLSESKSFGLGSNSSVDSRKEVGYSSEDCLDRQSSEDLDK